MDNIAAISFKCFRHPQKKVEAVCTEPFCNCYRFFCVQCFFEFSSHFISHKQAIHEIGDVFAHHQGNKQFKNSTISELQQELIKAKSHVKDYEQVIKAKHSSYMKVIDEVEKKFLHAKEMLVGEIEDYLANLVVKQHQHYTYLENKMKSHLQDASINDWMKMNKRNEAEITGFFENIIKSPSTSQHDLQTEIGIYLSSIKRSIYDLDNQNNSKMVSYFSGELSQIFQDKLKELKQILIMSAEEVQVQNSHQQFTAKLPGVHKAVATPKNAVNGSVSEEFWFKNYRTPSASIAGFGFGKGDGFNTSNYFEVETAGQNFYESPVGINSTILPRHIVENNPLHTGGICTMIVYQESSSKKILATGSRDCSIKFWQLESSSFEFIKTLKGHTSPVFAICKLEKEDNLFLASAAEDGQIKIWNPILQGKELLATLSSHSAAVTCILYVDEFLITGSLDKTVKIWNLDELFCSQTLTQDEEVHSICAFNRGNTKALVSGCGDGFRIWNQKKLGEFKLKSYNNKAHKKGISFVASIGARGIDIATAGKDGLIKLWNMEKGICVTQLEGHIGVVYQLEYLPQTGNLFSSSCDETIRAWDLEKQVRCFDNGSKFLQDCPKKGQFIVFEKDRFLLSASNDCCVIKTLLI